MARRLGCGAEASARCFRAAHRPSSPFFRHDVCTGRVVLAGTFGRGSRQRRAGSRLLPEIAITVSAELFFHHRAGAFETPGPGSGGGRCGVRVNSDAASSPDFGRHYSAVRRGTAGSRRSLALDRFRCLRRAGVARRVRRDRRAALAARSGTRGGALRSRRSRDRYRAPDLPATRMAQVRRCSARSVARRLRHAFSAADSVALRGRRPRSDVDRRTDSPRIRLLAGCSLRR